MLQTDYFERVGHDWLAGTVENLTTEIKLPSIVEFVEANRYLPASVTSIPGYQSYDLTPYMREPLECFHPDSPVREVNIMKGVQMSYTVGLLESILFYYMACLKVYPCGFMSADKELVSLRIKNNILTMLNQSGFGHIIQSNDTGNTRKTGKTEELLEWEGGGFMVPIGARNADKLRSHSFLLLLKDEVDAWLDTVGKDGCPDVISDSRCDAFEPVRKILRGSTPLLEGSSKIAKRYLQGDQRQYFILCMSCSFPQVISWRRKNKRGAMERSFVWETERGSLIADSVAWTCANCYHKHYNVDKEILNSTEHGAHWKPTARPLREGIRSYHLPAFYSPVGMKSWEGCVAQFLSAFDVEGKKVKDMGKYQIFRNNIEGKPFKIISESIVFEQVSGHRRGWYFFGQINNQYAQLYSGSRILFLTMQVDVHKSNLAVTIFGWCRHSIPYVLDYWRLEDEDCTLERSPVWAQLEELVTNKKYISDDGIEYTIFCTLIDSRYAQSTVVSFCARFAGWVFPIIGRQRATKSSNIKEFDTFKTKMQTDGYSITVDHYKDRIAPVLRKQWTPEAGIQDPYQFNVPLDMQDDQLKELTVETKRKKTDSATGQILYYWHRSSTTTPNELWDLLVYGHAAVEIIAFNICVEIFALENTINWDDFWKYMEKRLDVPDKEG